LSRAKDFFTAALAVVTVTNQFEDDDLWKNCGNIAAIFQTPCKNMDTVWLSL